MRGLQESVQLKTAFLQGETQELVRGRLESSNPSIFKGMF